MPSLWTNLVITPNFECHLDVLRDFVHRKNGIPTTAAFRTLGSESTLDPDEVSLVEVIMPLIDAHQIKAMSFLDSSPVLSYLLSRMVEQTITGHPTLSIAFSRLTTLSIFERHDTEGLCCRFIHLKQLLCATPHLKTLEVQHFTESDVSVDDEESAEKTVISLPMLENLTIIESTPLALQLLGSLFSPDVRRLKLLAWDPKDFDTTSYLFVNQNNNSDLKVPRFPKVRDLMLSCTLFSYLSANLIRVFPQITHLTLGSRSQFYEGGMATSPAPPAFQWLQYLRLTLQFFVDQDEDEDPRGCFTWLPQPKDRAEHLLLIHVIDDSDLYDEESKKLADRKLFCYYKELQQYGKIDENSSRLDDFRRWQADGEPELS
ncbi:hypothetical protein BJ138DRAFT_627994 [Hygrophoropsis aurantiaca]|uniref:Uncharacterized protein n=1 Tax=Hygrophoropsis aurantiaca TaxID=72124 RepID=A0ACB7ZZE4_9AGAM|nr:hypothetical protein BJ138DRAFT_627994 [Hygrophoropsis aurantiaca]